jgi:6-phosphofructokinase 1
MKNNIKRIAVLTSGGDAPGMNAAIRAVVRTAIYHNLHIFGYKRGYQGLIENEFVRLEASDVANIMHRGGTMLKTARSMEFMTPEGRKAAFESLEANDIHALITIGGNGTFTGAKLFSEEFQIPVIGIPGTIDNDLYGTDYTIGFDTAINTAVEAADKIRDTADSHNRLFFVEVMGRHSGYIGLYTGIGAGAGSIIIPENHRTIDELVNMLSIGKKRNKLFNLIMVAEGNEYGGAQQIADEVEKRISGYDTKVTIIGHLQRGGSPTCMDRVLASRLGYAAVEGIVNGHTNVMAGIINNKITYTALKDAITKQKLVDDEMVQMAAILAL